MVSLSFQWPSLEDTIDPMKRKRDYLKNKTAIDYDWSTQRFCKYFVAGHLSKAKKNSTWGRDTYTSTYVTFSPNGRELLANMGSEQIYLFDVFHGKPILKESVGFHQFLKQCDHVTEGKKSRLEHKLFKYVAK